VTGQTFRRAYGSGHSYTLDGEPRIKGVTTMMRGLKGPPEKYFTETTAGYAVDNWNRLAELPPSERLKEIAGATKRRFDTAALRGTRVHKLAEQLVDGEAVPVPDEIRGHVEACVQFLDDYQIDPVLVEPALFSREHKYAGSADLFARAILPGTEQKVMGLFDYKTSASGPWGSVAFQLSGYRYAEFYLDDDGEEQPVPEVDQCYAVWIRADGYEVYPVDTSEQILRQLLYIDQCRIADDECKMYRGDPLPHPEKIRPVRLADVADEESP
jgi:hypothetical protein